MDFGRKVRLKILRGWLHFGSLIFSLDGSLSYAREFQKRPTEEWRDITQNSDTGSSGRVRHGKSRACPCEGLGCFVWTQETG